MGPMQIIRYEKLADREIFSFYIDMMFANILHSPLKVSFTREVSKSIWWSAF